MSNQLKKAPRSIALLAHVSASRREPHFHSFIPGPKTGDFLRRGLVAQRRYDGFKILAKTAKGEFLEVPYYICRISCP